MPDEKAKAQLLVTLAAGEVARTLLAGEGVREERQLRTETVSGVKQLPPLSRPTIDTSQGRYVVKGELGRGGMGRVDEVFDTALGRAVAQKVVLNEAGEHPATLLVAEAQTCAQLEHPSIVPVYDIGADSAGNPYYTMRVIRGRTLRTVLDDNHDGRVGPSEKRSLVQLLGILRQVCLAVDYAHSRGVVHRDLKPENIIVGEFGEVYVLDWGVAHVVDGSDIRRATYERFIAGSPGYMAPEQVMGSMVDARTDVFALGVILYELLAGVRPFEDSDSHSVRSRLERDVEAAPSSRNSTAPNVFDALVLGCLSHVPSARPSSARIIADAIDRYLDVERDRLQREREAQAHSDEGEAALEAYVSLSEESRRLLAEAQTLLAAIAGWESDERKRPAWNLRTEANRLAAEAARALARAEAAFARALGRVANHSRARRGLAMLHFYQFEAAERDGERENMAQHLDLARTYDDGPLALELADRGELIVESDPPGAVVTVARYEPDGPLFSAREHRTLGSTPTNPLSLESGSYLVTARHGDRELRYPLRLRRAKTHRLKLRMRTATEVPPGMVVIPGGPFLAPMKLRGLEFEERTLPDFAIARFPVTMREYARWLDSLEPTERARRALPDLVMVDGAWRLGDAIDGDDRKWIPVERELDMPAFEMSWYTASRYIQWLSRETGAAYRLPESLEWDKAMRGADGRLFPMGPELDPSFAKVRESRPGSFQPEPVGVFTRDESPYGIRDLAGGVGDWTRTPDDDGPPLDPDAEGTEHDERLAVWRGGTWSTTSTNRSLLRYSQSVKFFSGWIGFRLAMSLEGEGSSLTVESMERAPTTQRS